MQQKTSVSEGLCDRELLGVPVASRTINLRQGKKNAVFEESRVRDTEQVVPRCGSQSLFDKTSILKMIYVIPAMDPPILHSWPLVPNVSSTKSCVEEL